MGTSMTAPKRTNVTAPSRPPVSSRKQCHLAADLATEPAEDGTADEGGDEPAAVHPHRQPVGERGRGDRYDLNPVSSTRRRGTPTLSTAAAASPAITPATASVADLLEHELHRRAVSDRARLRLGDRDRDEQQRHADPVVEPALDVEPLTDRVREPGDR